MGSDFYIYTVTLPRYNELMACSMAAVRASGHFIVLAFLTQ
jgi:hypothetical protein